MEDAARIPEVLEAGVSSVSKLFAAPRPFPWPRAGAGSL
jgi:hypothetical protein